MKKGYAYSIISALLFGSAGLIVKLAFAEGVDSINLLIIQYIIAVAIMFLIIFIRNKRLLKIPSKSIIDLCILGVVGNTFMTVFYYLSYEYLPMSIVTILLYTYPVVVYVYLYISKLEKITIRKTAALILAFSGCILALGISEKNIHYSILGVIFGILASIFFAFMNIFSEKRFDNLDSLVVNAYSTLFSLISLIIYRPPLFIFRDSISLNLVKFTFILSVLCEIVPLTLMYAAIKYIGALKVSIIGNLEIPTAMLLSYFILQERITLIQILGTVLVFYAVYIIRK